MKNRIAFIGVYITLALMFSYVEMLIPISFSVPGIKLGLANVVIVIALYRLPLKECFLISLLRVIVASFLFSNLSMMIYSLVGALFSLIAMCMLKRISAFTIISVSVIGAVFHNIGQIITAMFLLETWSLISYLPLLLVSAIITGMLMGVISQEVLRRINKLEL